MLKHEFSGSPEALAEQCNKITPPSLLPSPVSVPPSKSGYLALYIGLVALFDATEEYLRLDMAYNNNHCRL